MTDFLGVSSAYELDHIQLEFVNWVTTYQSVVKNVTGKDRTDALSYIDHDAQFDIWLQKFAKDKEEETQQMGRKQNKSSGSGVSQEAYLNRTKGMMPNPSRK